MHDDCTGITVVFEEIAYLEKENTKLKEQIAKLQKVVDAVKEVVVYCNPCGICDHERYFACAIKDRCLQRSSFNELDQVLKELEE